MKPDEKRFSNRNKKHTIAQMSGCKGPRDARQDLHTRSSEGTGRKAGVLDAGIWKDGASAPEAAPNERGRRWMTRRATLFVWNVLNLPPGTLPSFSFRASPRFHFCPPHNLTAAFRFLAPFVAPSPLQLTPPRRRPTSLDRLPSPCDSQRVRRHIFPDRASRRHIRAVAN